ncbi:MAG: hypothetical protein HYS07_02990 [Chlamydiae bacterium]|nr:hypothetical protein [Chlamydiota bacterium]
MITTKKYCKLNQYSDETARKDFQDLTRFHWLRPSCKRSLQNNTSLLTYSRFS